MSEWRWLNAAAVYAIHDRLIAEHGGVDGVVSGDLVESALAKPQHLAAYAAPDAAELAASYAYGLVNNHGFADGNKRTAWVAARLFLADNGVRLRFDPFDAIRLMQTAAGGEVTEAGIAAWFRERIVR